MIRLNCNAVSFNNYCTFGDILPIQYGSYLYAKTYTVNLIRAKIVPYFACIHADCQKYLTLINYKLYLCSSLKTQTVSTNHYSTWNVTKFEQLLFTTLMDT